MSLDRQVLRTVRQYQLLTAGERVVMAVSGGADSLALLHLLHHLRGRIGCELHAATFDHRLRGAESAADAAYVVKLCAQWGIPVTAGAWESPAAGAGVEAKARAARYDFLAGVARQIGASRVAVGHHADDQAETVLMHLLRGAGLEGLGGMRYAAPLPGHPSLTVIRPLLAVTRSQIDAYCQQQGVQPRFDPTNLDQTLLRNRLRHEVLPLLTTVIPGVAERLGQLAELAQVEGDFVGQALRQFIHDQVRSETAPRRVSVPRAAFVQLHPAVQRRLIGWAVQQVSSESHADLGYRQILAAVEVGRESDTGAIAQMPSGCQLRVAYDWLVIEESDGLPALPDLPLLESDTVLPVAVPGETPLGGGWVLRVSTEPPPGASVPVILPRTGQLALRTRRETDRFAPAGMGGHTRKLNRWLTDRKIPQHLRDHLPVLTLNGVIIAIIFADAFVFSHREDLAAADSLPYWLECGKLLRDR